MSQSLHSAHVAAAASNVASAPLPAAASAASLTARAGACRKSVKDPNCLFFQKRDNPYDVDGAIVGGPASNDTWIDERNKFEFTEVAIDYNIGMTMALTTSLAGPSNMFTGNCAWAVPHYPKRFLYGKKG
jgi:Glycosyl hydrolase family 9